MTISDQITRLQNAKAALKSKIESDYGSTIPSSAHLEDYPSYMVQAKPTDPGVYIIYSDNSFSSYNQLTTGKTPAGVGLVTSNVSLLIHKDETTGIQWGGYGTTITNCFTTTDQATAKTDFGGKTNTDAIISQLGAANAPGANWARNTCAYANGAVGWLPSCGEMEEIRLNGDNVNTALSLIGGTQIAWSSKSYFCSTQYNGSYAWLWNCNYSNWGDTNKGSTRGSFRSVAAF